MKTPFAATPALTRAQIDAIVSAGALLTDSPSSRRQSDAMQRSPGSSVICNARDAETRAAQSRRTAAVAAATYGCVDWYIYPDSHGESEAA
ncbi:MAG TPA: hypothetical protein VN676_08675 [Steroidobacteraceae bacterium]|jgi:hypothetical protein|nr:hypothetical protein [Steroidobacteraceae bacterium]